MAARNDAADDSGLGTFNNKSPAQTKTPAFAGVCYFTLRR